MALGTSVASDIANAALDFYVRGPALAQTIQDKPLLSKLRAASKTFPGGKEYISEPIKGTYMNTVSGFFAGYKEDEQLVFKQAANLLRAQYKWYEVHAGLIITWTELKKDGVTITDDAKVSDHGEDVHRLTSLLEDRVSDYTEAWSRAFNTMLWSDGTQDSEQVPGLQALFQETNNVETIGGLSQATYSYWRHRLSLAIVPNAETQTLTKTLRREQRQLRRYGGKPSINLAGSEFLEALDLEAEKKMTYSQTGLSGGKDISIGALSIAGLGTFEYDPTMDDIGLAKYCFVLDGRRTRLRPMQGEDMKVLNPTRPYDYMVFLKSMTWTGGLECTQMNANGIYSIA